MNPDRDAAVEADDPAQARTARVIGMTDARLAQLVAENRRLQEALRDARQHALEAAAAACAQAEVPSEAGGVWFLGLTDTVTRQACVDAVRRLAYDGPGRTAPAEHAERRDAHGG